MFRCVFAEIWFDSHRIWMRLIASVLLVLLERRSVMTALALATCRRIRDCGVGTLTFSENLGSCRSRSAKLCCIPALNISKNCWSLVILKDIWNILKMARGLEFGGMIFRSTWWAGQALTGFSTISMHTSPLHGRSMLLLKVVTVWERGAVPLVFAPQAVCISATSMTLYERTGTVLREIHRDTMYKMSVITWIPSSRLVM